MPGTNYLIHELFLEQACRTPANIAVVCTKRTLRYSELAAESNAVGHRLRQLGCRPNGPVAVVMDKGWEQIVGVLGILASGAPYLPIDPKVPGERLRYLLQDGEVQVVLTQSWLEKTLEWPAGIECISVDQASDGRGLPLLEPLQTPDDLAYILYTSGSTGSPKGVMIGHRGLVNSILETNRQFSVTERDRVLAVTALHHDMSAFDIFGMLAAGGALVMPAKDSARAPDHWMELIERCKVTIWNSVPAFFQMLLDFGDIHDATTVNSLRISFLGGDWIPLSTPPRAWKRFGNIQVVSVGGPTETTLWNIWYAVQQMDPAWRSIPYGHPIANTRYYVLDDSLRECPVDVAGELWCAGVGLMKGYWHDEARTRDKFAAHPGTGERIYRTGDRGRLRPDGEIEFLGRTDAQVKILGQRIELGEIESILGQFPGIRQAAVKVATVGDQPRLVAYVVSPGEPRIREIRVHLERNLPCHMVPSAVEYLPSLPLTANGKVNREALPMPRIWMPATSCMAPESPVREPIHEIWRDVLKVEQVGIDDNFFDRGGNSLLLVQVHAELLRRLNLNLPVTALFEFPTIRALRRHINGLSSNDGPEDLEARMNSRRQALARRRAVMSRHD